MRKIPTSMYQYLVWKRPGQPDTTVTLAKVYRDVKDKGGRIYESRIKSATLMIRAILNLYAIDHVFTPAEADERFMTIFKEHCGFATSQEAKDNLNLGKLPSLLNNKMTAIVINISLIASIIHSPDPDLSLLDEITGDLPTILEQLKIIEEWIFYNKPLMKRLLAGPKMALDKTALDQL